MAGKATPQPQGGGTEGFFAAVDSLTYREMREVSGLLALQLEGKDVTDAALVAEALADASDSFSDTGEED